MIKKNTTIKQKKRFDAYTEGVFVINVTNKKFADNFKKELLMFGLPEDYILIESPNKDIKGDTYKMLIANASVNMRYVIDLMRSKGLTIKEIEDLLGVELEEMSSNTHVIGTAVTGNENVERFVK